MQRRGTPAMRLLRSLAAGLAVTRALAETSAAVSVDAMVPLYVYPGNSTWTNPEWQAAVDAIKSNRGTHFYIVINPNNGPLNTSDPSGDNGGFCNVEGDDYIEHGCNRDWSTHIETINKQSNAQTLGYVWTGYGSRDVDDVKRDIAEWAAWEEAPTWVKGEEGDIRIHGLWFDEVGAGSGNFSMLSELITYANETFAASKKKKKKSDDYAVVLNAGPVANATYEAQLFGLADTVVTKETCFTTDPVASGVGWDCPLPYAPFDYTTLTAGNGLPHDSAFLPQTAVIVHQFTGVNATPETLQAQMDGLVGLGVRSTYFTSGSWHETTLSPATIENVGEILNVVNGDAASLGGVGWIGWLPWAAGAYLYMMSSSL